MYRARRTIQPKIPLMKEDFSQVLPESRFNQHYIFTVSTTNDTAVAFASKRMLNSLSKVTHMGFINTVSIQFYQLWTIFVTVEKRFYAIHCLQRPESL